MLPRRVDKTEPRNASAMRPFNVPDVWLMENRSSVYDAILSSIACVNYAGF